MLNRNTKSGKKNKRKMRNIVRFLLAIIIVLVLVDLVNVIHLFHKKPVTANEYTKGANSKPLAAPTVKSSSSISSNTSNSKDTVTSSSSGTIQLASPTGDFVSDHHPNLSGSPAPNTITSVCTTTPGATCTIIFTMNSTTKSLPRKTVDAGGSAYWINWQLQSVGLTAGSWQVKAAANLNGQTETSTDATDLDISQ